MHISTPKKFLPFVGHKTVFWLSVSFFCSIFLAIIELLIALFLQIFLVTLGIVNTPVSFYGLKLTNWSIMYVLSFLILIGFLRFILQVFATHSSRFALEFSNSRFKNLAVYDLIYKISGEAQGISDVNYNISEIFPKSAEFLFNTTQFLSFFIQCFVLIVIMSFTTPKESILAIIGIVIIGYIVHIINRRVRKIAYTVPLEQKKLNAGIEKISKNLLFVKIMKTSNSEHKKLIENVVNYCLKATRAGFLGTLAGTLSPFLGILMLVIIIFISQLYWQTPSLILISFLYLLVRFIQNLATLAQYFGLLNMGYPQIKAALGYFYKFEVQERQLAVSPSDVAVFIGSKNHYSLPNIFLGQEKIFAKTKETELPSIKFLNVSFSYPNTNIFVLNSFSFEVNSGEHIGIIGPSGVGKSTILMLILGIFKPTSGNILISNLEPEQYFASPYSKVGYVGPEPFLIRGSIKENLLYGIRREVSENQIWESLKLASLYEFVSSITLDYFIPEDQSGLSAGQKQRLCLARAFLNEPQLLVLDEATANLDETTERDIATTLEKLKKKCTVIVVSHRAGILASVDKTIDLR